VPGNKRMLLAPPDATVGGKKLEYFPQAEMVSWFQPIQLLSSAVRVFFATELAAYIDRREIQAVLPKPVSSVAGSVPDTDGANENLEAREEVWIDFIADVGDGWDSTYSMAMLLGRDRLLVNGLDGPLQRAGVLVLGGDQVYPTPSRDGYRTRFEGPYTAALPDISGEAPRMFAIPGNHDWYDGLTHFLRKFCQGGSIGAWRLSQSRSYFAVKLPHNWWLWGTDIQLDTRIDAVQLEFFRNVGIERGDRVILCTGKPSWVFGETIDKEAFDNFLYFEHETILSRDATVPVTLSGDFHHYARYLHSPVRQKITSGGGGAFLRGTHDLPRRLAIPANPAYDTTEQYVESGFAYPTRERSRQLAKGALLFPFRRANLMFCAGCGFIYALIVALLNPTTSSADTVLLLPAYLWNLRHALQTRPIGVLFALGVVIIPAVYAVLFNLKRPHLGTASWGLLHGVAHVLAALVVGWGFSAFGIQFLKLSGWREVLFAYGPMVIAGGLVAGLLVGIYLVLSDSLFGWHATEVFSCQAIPDYKNFLRLHIDKNGKLTIYPIGVARVARHWRRFRHRQPGQPYFEPADDRLLEAHLIEGPLIIPPDPLTVSSGPLEMSSPT
jgi:hypothetical protein